MLNTILTYCSVFTTTSTFTGIVSGGGLPERLTAANVVGRRMYSVFRPVLPQRRGVLSTRFWGHSIASQPKVFGDYPESEDRVMPNNNCWLCFSGLPCY